LNGSGAAGRPIGGVGPVRGGTFSSGAGGHCFSARKPSAAFPPCTTTFTEFERSIPEADLILNERSMLPGCERSSVWVLGPAVSTPSRGGTVISIVTG
jgi:hypothetical protein